MTEAEIETQAEIYAKGKHCKDCSNISMCWENAIDDCCTICERTNDDFIAGAKWGAEHAIEWHKSEERPKGHKQDFDVALKVLNYNTKQIEQDYGYYSVEYDKFYHSKSKLKIIAWCELPQFKE